METGSPTHQPPGIRKRIGITATVPAEILLSAGLEPVDLNNLFITSEQPEKLVSGAEAAGFSHGICAWIKGIYSAVMQYGITDVKSAPKKVPITVAFLKTDIPIYTAA